MSDAKIRNFIPDDIPQIMGVQQAYQQIYPQATLIPGEVYLSPGFAHGGNIFCAFVENNGLQGYAPVYPNLSPDKQIPHLIWAEIKVHPGLSSARNVKELLFAQVVNLTREITQESPGQQTCLTFQYHPTETESIEFVISKGCVYTESVFRMRCELNRDFPVLSPPEHITIQRWRIASKKEQLAYIQARNEAFPEAPTRVEDWENFLASPAWRNGTTLTAFEGEEVIGSVAVYWDEAISQMTGTKGAYTEYIFVREKWRQRGIASVLINQGLGYLKDHGREAAYLEVRASNRRALELYERLGYQVVDETRLYVLEI